jgi:hypothetical protein
VGRRNHGFTISMIRLRKWSVPLTHHWGHALNENHDGLVVVP